MINKIFILIAFSCIVGNYTAKCQVFKKYHNNEYRLSISIPETWSYTNSVDSFAGEKIIMTFIGGQKEVSENEILASTTCILNVLNITDTNDFLKIKNKLQYKNPSTSEWNSSINYSDTVKCFLDHSTVTDTSKMYYLHDRYFYNQISTQFFFLDKKYIYIISCTCPEKNIKQYKDIFLNIANSFTLNKI